MTALKLSIDLNVLRIDAKNKVDKAAGRVRQNFITTIPGQEMVYTNKESEAKQVKARLDIDPNDPLTDLNVPHIIREADADGMTYLEKANQVLQKADEWRQLSAIIDEIRYAQKKLIDEANTPNSIEALTVVDWAPVYQAAGM